MTIACRPRSGRRTSPLASSIPGRASRHRLLPKIGVIRNLGPTSWQVADVASGRVDVFWEFGRDVANLLAGSLIAAEAGAIVTDAQGIPWTFASHSFVAAAPGLHPKVIEILADVTVDSARRHDDYAAAGRVHRRPELCFSTA